MTEYTFSSERIREYKNAKSRTTYWVSEVTDTELYSPSVPRSELDQDEGLSEPSDVESSHSIPPKLMLRYSDGRPDVPIPHVRDISPWKTGSNRGSDSVARSQTFPQNPVHSGSIPHTHHSIGRTRGPDGRERLISNAPEEIRILPSQPIAGSRNGNGSYHVRSKSLPRNAFNPMAGADPSPVPPLSLPPSRVVSKPLYTPGFVPTSHALSAQHVAFSQPPPFQVREHSRHQPPSIIYAPSHHSRHATYHPPTVFSHPPKIGPNGMIYSHSAPVPSTQYPPIGATPYPSAYAPSERSHSDRHHGNSRRSRSRTRSRTRSSGRGPMENVAANRSTPSVDSNHSGSTYYVLPTDRRQKIHVLHTPDLTVYTGSSTSKSPTTPVSPASAGSLKRPFFQRLFHFAERFSSAGSSKGSNGGGRHIRRRHSTEHL